MPWSAPVETNNYDVYDNKDDALQATSDLGFHRWISDPEIASFMCNQDDNCNGFVMDKNGSGVWFKKTNNERVPSKNANNRKTYVKKSTSWEKAANPDTTRDGVLPDNERKTQFLACKNVNERDNTCWLSNAKNVKVGASCDGDRVFVNDTVGFKIPLGFRYFVNDSGGGLFNTDGGFWSSYQGNGRDTPGDKVFDSGMRNKSDCMVLQNVGFDVDQYWDTMTQTPNNVHPDDAAKIKENWCRSRNRTIDELTTNTNKNRCVQALGNQDEYTKEVINRCSELSDWTKVGKCMDIVTREIQNNAANAGQARTMVQRYCRGDPNNKKGMGPGRNTQLCACMNASDFGFADPDNNVNNTCYAPDKQNLPGCTDLILKTTKLVSNSLVPSSVLWAIQTSVNDTGTIADSCATARQACDGTNSQACVLPYQPSSARIENTFNICAQVAQAQISQDSPVNQVCGFTTNLGGSGGGTVTTTGDGRTIVTGAPGSGGGDETGGETNDNTKWYIGGGSSSLVSVCILVIIAVLFLTLM